MSSIYCCKNQQLLILVFLILFISVTAKSNIECSEAAGSFILLHYDRKNCREQLFDCRINQKIEIKKIKEIKNINFFDRSCKYIDHERINYIKSSFNGSDKGDFENPAYQKIWSETLNLENEQYMKTMLYNQSNDKTFRSLNMDYPLVYVYQCPEISKIFFIGFKHDTGDVLYAFDKNYKPVKIFSDISIRNPELSPDGKKLSYYKIDPYLKSGFELVIVDHRDKFSNFEKPLSFLSYRMNKFGQNSVITGSPVFDIKKGKGIRIPHKHWSPDGKFIVLNAFMNGNRYLSTHIVDTYPANYKFYQSSISFWNTFLKELKEKNNPSSELIYSCLDNQSQKVVDDFIYDQPITTAKKDIIVNSLNSILESRAFYKSEVFKEIIKNNQDLRSLYKQVSRQGYTNKLSYLNRMMLQTVFPDYFNLTTANYNIYKLSEIQTAEKVLNPDFDWTSNGLVITSPGSVKIFRHIPHNLIPETIKTPSGFSSFKFGRLSKDGRFLLFLAEKSGSMYVCVLDLKFNKTYAKPVGKDLDSDNYQIAWKDGGITHLNRYYEYSPAIWTFHRSISKETEDN